MTKVFFKWCSVTLRESYNPRQEPSNAAADPAEASLVENLVAFLLILQGNNKSSHINICGMVIIADVVWWSTPQEFFLV